MFLSLGSIPLESLSMNDLPICSSTARLSKGIEVNTYVEIAQLDK